MFVWQAHLHHYCTVEGMHESLFEESISSLNSLIAEYEDLQATIGKVQGDAQRLKICWYLQQCNYYITFLLPWLQKLKHWALIVIYISSLKHDEMKSKDVSIEALKKHCN